MMAFRDDNGKIWLQREAPARGDRDVVQYVDYEVSQADALRLARELLEAAGVKLPEWVKTSDRLPEGKGDGTYEQIPCLVVVDGQAEICVWNCTHECWDDSEGDDHRYDPLEVTCWMPLSSLPDWRKCCGSNCAQGVRR